jgi:hypothetical protein
MFFRLTQRFGRREIEKQLSMPLLVQSSSANPRPQLHPLLQTRRLWSPIQHQRLSLRPAKHLHRQVMHLIRQHLLRAHQECPSAQRQELVLVSVLVLS